MGGNQQSSSNTMGMPSREDYILNNAYPVRWIDEALSKYKQFTGGVK